ncbi:hypothetical protein [Polaribacter gangjinensis]|uniref:Uncharacterized protein n=1 Tax=Polaribacter gangjinensis TaxID=574710 RepID=A0A2S7WEW3_9FLAO|nr:hypothetical protein [Polaribacter gangjinensis]PQJ75956.1 hypothetical protein BTO13_12295 [Polaribacter gangjinensis]
MKRVILLFGIIFICSSATLKKEEVITQSVQLTDPYDCLIEKMLIRSFYDGMIESILVGNYPGTPLLVAELEQLKRIELSWACQN